MIHRSPRPRWTTEDFDALSWHDCVLWSLQIRIGGSAEDDWTSDLVLGLDFITEWLPAGRFRVAPAELIFHGVTDLRVGFGPEERSFVSLPLPAIEVVEREPVPDAPVFLDSDYFRWTIRFADPHGGAIEFGAVDFSQSLLADPVELAGQQFTLSRRSELLRRGEGDRT